MEVPGSARSVGWFTAGPTPGETGTSIIAGHTDYGYLRGAFHRLHEIRAGDPISVRREDGRTAVFTARPPTTSRPTVQERKNVS
jgi:hypothetical protein